MGSQIQKLTIPQFKTLCGSRWFFFPVSRGRDTPQHSQRLAEILAVGPDGAKWPRGSDLNPLEPQSEESLGASQGLSPRRHSAFWGSDVVFDMY